MPNLFNDQVIVCNCGGTMDIDGKKLAKECLKRLFRGCDNLRISDLRDDNPGSSTSTTTTTSKLDKAKSTCTELGFTLGTEKHGECVLKMMDK